MTTEAHVCVLWKVRLIANGGAQITRCEECALADLPEVMRGWNRHSRTAFLEAPDCVTALVETIQLSGMETRLCPTCKQVVETPTEWTSS